MPKYLHEYTKVLQIKYLLQTSPSLPLPPVQYAWLGLIYSIPHGDIGGPEEPCCAPDNCPRSARAGEDRFAHVSIHVSPTLPRVSGGSRIHYHSSFG